MSPTPVPAHSRVIMNLSLIFGNFLKGKAPILLSKVDVHLSRKNRFVPDIIVVCDRSKIKPVHGVHGAPDLVVEVLSPSTEKRDRLDKKKAYEEAGVKEYWLINAKSRSIEIYSLTDGRLELVDSITEIPDYEIERMSEEAVNAIVREFSPVLFPDLIIQVGSVFYNILE
jgi:Uma2 family endonuclease